MENFCREENYKKRKMKNMISEINVSFNMPTSRMDRKKEIISKLESRLTGSIQIKKKNKQQREHRSIHKKIKLFILINSNLNLS